MVDAFQMLGEYPAATIAHKLREIGDDEAAEFYEFQAARMLPVRPEGFFTPRRWLDTEHQFGFIPLFKPGADRFHPIVSASNIAPDPSLMHQRINIRLDRLYAHSYPPPLLHMGTPVHTILFTFEARNQVEGGSEAIACNQTYHARSGQGAAVAGSPIFIGLTVGTHGIDFKGKTVHIGNASDEQLVTALTSEVTVTGLSLLTTAQPALAPFIKLAQQLALMAGNRWKNTPIQRFQLGLDYDTGASGARLAIGSYVVAQVRRPDEIVWSDWSYDAETGTIVRTYLADGEEAYTLPHNTVIVRVSAYQE